MGLREGRKYSERLGVIEPAKLNAVAEQFDLGEIVDAWPPSGGLFGQNVILETTEGRYVFRGHPHGHGQLTKERRVAGLINAQSSLSAPWPHRVSDDTELFGWTYAVMPMLPGVCGEDLWAVAGAEARVELAGSCGNGLAMLHEVAGATCGLYEERVDDFVPVDSDFPEWWLRRLNELRMRCREADALSSDAEQFIDDVVEQDLPALDEPFTPVLVHHDFKPGNLNFIQVGTSFEPSGVFDLFEAYFADPEEDLVRMLWSVETDDERRAFIAGYTDEKPLRSGAADRLELYTLADWLVAWEYGKRNRIWFCDVTFVESVQPVLAAARAAAS